LQHPLNRRCRQITFILGGVLTILGGMGAIGWVPGLEILAQLRPDYIPMAPATATIFLVLGIGALLNALFPEKSAVRWYFVMTSTVVTVFAAFILFAWLAGIDVDMEKIFVSNAGTFGQVALGRMSPLTAANFLFDGAAILALTAPGPARFWRGNLAGVLASCAAAVTATVLLGYLFGSPLLYGMNVIPMAFSTALAFFALDSMVLVLVGRECFPARSFCGDTTRAKLLRAFLPVVPVVIIVNGLLYQTIQRIAPDMNHALYNALAALIATSILAIFITGVARVIGHDIDLANSERLVVQRKLLHGYKLSALGEMAGNIAHELTNPLAIIEGKSRQLGKILSKDQIDVPYALEFCQTIGETSRRLVKITNGLKTMSRSAEKDPYEARSVASIVEETLAICQGRLKYSEVDISVETISSALTIDCRPTEISQIILNLVSNAHDAVEYLAEKWIKITVVDDKSHVQISVIDSGSGIPPEVRKKIATAFFTTKPAGKGTGLGLSISTGLAESYGGSLTLDIQSLHTKFDLKLPKRQNLAS